MTLPRGGQDSVESQPIPDCPAAADTGADVAWLRWGRVAGYVCAGSLLLTTLLYLVDSAGLLGSGPVFRRTGRGREADIASFFAAFFYHEHHIAWDIALRDSLGPLAYLALLVLVVAYANVIGWRDPRAQGAVIAVAAGAVFAAWNSVTFLGELNYWRYGGWRPRPAVDMIAVGRTAEGIDHLTVFPEVVGFVLVAVGFVMFGQLLNAHPGVGVLLRLLPYCEAVVLAALAVAEVAQLDSVYNVLALVAGIVVGPVLAVTLARHLRLTERLSSTYG